MAAEKVLQKCRKALRRQEIGDGGQDDGYAGWRWLIAASHHSQRFVGSEERVGGLFHPAEGDVAVVVAEKVADGEFGLVVVAVALERLGLVGGDETTEFAAKIAHRAPQRFTGIFCLF